jgi:hypothetical protein
VENEDMLDAMDDEAAIEALMDDANFQYLMQESMEPVYDGSTQTRMQVGIVIYSIITLYSVPNTCTNTLLTYIAGDLLPTSNCMLRSTYEMKKMLMKMELKHDGIHCCPKGHVLYKEDNENLDACPTYNKDRYIEGSNDVPVSVLQHFLVVKQLQRMFKCLEVGAKMTWYDERRSEPGIICSIVDSKQWTTIDQMFEEFARIKINLRLGLVADGIIPF